MTLAERARRGDQGVTRIPAGVMIETRGPKHSLFLRQWHEAYGETYKISRGVYGEEVLRCFVERGTGPWPRRAH